MPIHGMNMGECPGNTANAEPTGYFRVFIDVTRIVIINEVVPERLAENKPCQARQNDADADGRPLAVDFRRAYRWSSEAVHALRSKE
jgi:hypothetical protein